MKKKMLLLSFGLFLTQEVKAQLGGSPRPYSPTPSTQQFGTYQQPKGGTNQPKAHDFGVKPGVAGTSSGTSAAASEVEKKVGLSIGSSGNVNTSKFTGLSSQGKQTIESALGKSGTNQTCEAMRSNVVQAYEFCVRGKTSVAIDQYIKQLQAIHEQIKNASNEALSAYKNSRFEEAKSILKKKDEQILKLRNLCSSAVGQNANGYVVYDNFLETCVGLQASPMKQRAENDCLVDSQISASVAKYKSCYTDAKDNANKRQLEVNMQCKSQHDAILASEKNLKGCFSSASVNKIVQDLMRLQNAKEGYDKAVKGVKNGSAIDFSSPVSKYDQMFTQLDGSIAEISKNYQDLLKTFNDLKSRKQKLPKSMPATRVDYQALAQKIDQMKKAFEKLRGSYSHDPIAYSNELLKAASAYNQSIIDAEAKDKLAGDVKGNEMTVKSAIIQLKNSVKTLETCFQGHSKSYQAQLDAYNASSNLQKCSQTGAKHMSRKQFKLCFDLLYRVGDGVQDASGALQAVQETDCLKTQ